MNLLYLNKQQLLQVLILILKLPQAASSVSKQACHVEVSEIFPP